jgi:hypothetical protein
LLAACKEDPPPDPQEYIYSYPAVTLPSPTLNFQPVGLPAEITYTLLGGTTTWNSANGFNGVVSGSTYGAFTETTFTQTFYKDSKQIGQNIVKASTNSGASFFALNAANDATIQKIPDVVLTY